ncbi:TonB-dependent receptor [Pseudoduganella flava]|uniref:TonB-dependent receptor n=1 Tax=Pseudoduganella flava TaxID=871742 RepID=A0A562PQI1_9BURK|nr:TonB-dependent receptor [Pseudoduganella flava]QGZ37790.1 TonB-dependent receptor [Pseudoduganella flava]TWI46603.1 TonB-dependent receptor [Pseudoduganella flava]
MNTPANGTVPARPFNLKMTVAALAAAGIVTPASVWAQDAQGAAEREQASAGPTVVVTGVRRAAQSAQAIKKNSDEVIDSIVAEEAGKFPDKNVAEILGRVSGVQIRREYGEAANVVIRGLTGFVTLLNGREVYTSRDRSLYLADIPTTMLQRVDVYKTQGAEMVEGGTAGVIDVRTARPFDFAGFNASMAGRVENRDKSKTNDPQVSGTISNRWKGDFGEFGALLGLSYQKGHYHDEVTWNSPPTAVLGAASPVTGPNDLGHVLYEGKRDRTAANWAFQWRPSKAFEMFAEGWSTRVDHDAQRQFFVANQGWGPNSQYTLMPGTNQVAAVTSTNANPFTLSSTQAPNDDSETHQGAIGARWKVNDDWTVTTELARTNSKWKQDFPILDLLASPPTVSGETYRNGGGYFTYPNYDMMNPANYRMHTFFDQWSNAHGASNDWRADATWNPGSDGLIREIGFGVRLAERNASYQHESNGQIAPPAGLPAVGSLSGFACTSFPMANDYGLASWVTPCAGYLHANMDKLRQLYGRAAGRQAADPYSLYTNQEDTSAIYGKTRFGFTVGAVPVEGTAGVRVVRTKLDVNGFSGEFVNGVQVPVPVNQKTSSTDAMPNLTLKAMITPQVIGRFNAGKAIQRPAFADFNPGTTYNNGGGGTVDPTANGGNPNLKPVEGTNYDVAGEWYFAPTGSLTATLFKHDFKNYVIRRNTFETVNGIRYLTERPRNVEGGELKGIELAYRQFYDWLPGWLGGFGLEANYTYMEGHLMDNGVKNPFVNMSRNAFNIVALYERGPWSGRLAYNYRSSYVDTYNYRGLGFDLIVDPIKTADASITYKINDKLGITLDVENLNDRTYHDYHGIASNPRDIRRYDRVVGLSMRWKM